MGEVYAVVDNETQRTRVLKLVAGGGEADAKSTESFRLEAVIGARIHSEHIVEVIDAGVESGCPWLVMEHLRGEDLAKLIARRGRFEPRHAKLLLAQLCHGLAAAHDAGVVHRDLKPANVFVAKSKRSDVTFTVKVLDFGIARVLAEGQRATAASRAIGTPAYSAPEQASVGAEITPATDVWALGLIAFELLTGRPYWRAANIEHPSYPQIIAEVLTSPLVPASQRAQELGVPHPIPSDFDAWFARCVVREPGLRYTDAGAAWKELSGALDSTLGPPVPAGMHRVTATPPTIPFAAPTPIAPTVPFISASPPVRWRSRFGPSLLVVLPVGFFVAALAWWFATNEVADQGPIAVGAQGEVHDDMQPSADTGAEGEPAGTEPDLEAQHRPPDAVGEEPGLAPPPPTPTQRADNAAAPRRRARRRAGRSRETPAEPPLDPREAEQGTDPLTQHDIRAVVQRERPGIQWCYEVAARQTGLAPPLRLDVLIRIGQRGIVMSARAHFVGDRPPVETPESHQAWFADFPACVERSVRRWEFPLASESTETSVPFLFTARE